MSAAAGDGRVDAAGRQVADLVHALLDAGGQVSSEFVPKYGVKTCDSTWHDSGHSIGSTCNVCGGTRRRAVAFGKHVTRLIRVPEDVMTAVLQERAVASSEHSPAEASSADSQHGADPTSVAAGSPSDGAR